MDDALNRLRSAKEKLGWSWPRVARHLGVTLDGVEQALYRTKRINRLWVHSLEDAVALQSRLDRSKK